MIFPSFSKCKTFSWFVWPKAIKKEPLLSSVAPLCWFPQIAITKYHELGGLSQWKCIRLQLWRLELKIQVSVGPAVWASRERMYPWPLSQLLVGGTPRHSLTCRHTSPFYLCCHRASSMWVCLPVSLLLLWHSHTEIRAYSRLAAWSHFN